MILTPCLSKKTKKIMESNISHDHIALEAMKIILNKTTYRSYSLMDRIRVLFGLTTKVCIYSHPDLNNAAKKAYQIADAMIAERNNNNND